MSDSDEWSNQSEEEAVNVSSRDIKKSNHGNKNKLIDRQAAASFKKDLTEKLEMKSQNRLINKFKNNSKDRSTKCSKRKLDEIQDKNLKGKRKKMTGASGVTFSETFTNKSIIHKKDTKIRSSLSSGATAVKSDDTSENDDSDDIGDDSDDNADDSDDNGDDIDGNGDDSDDVDIDKKEDTNDEYAAVRQELANMPFEDLIKLQQKLGTKAYNQVMGKHKDTVKPVGKQTYKRENKNRPVELSSKKRVPHLREVVTSKKKVNRDPRFDDLSGEYDEHYFKKCYSFLDNVKTREKEKLSKLVKKEKDKSKRIKMQHLLNRMNQQEMSVKHKEKQKEIEKKWTKLEQKRVKAGKTPFYLKAADKRKLELADKYRELKKSGQLEKYLTKKKKKTAQKEKKKLPNQHMKFS